MSHLLCLRSVHSPDPQLGKSPVLVLQVTEASQPQLSVAGAKLTHSQDGDGMARGADHEIFLCPPSHASENISGLHFQ